jgi:hypothetical protein
MWAKLESMAEGARIASAELWSRKAQPEPAAAGKMS